MDTWGWLLFSFDDEEIDRWEFWQGLAVIVVYGFAAYWLAFALGDGYNVNSWIAVPAWLVGAWMLAAVGAKRCLDRGKPMWVVAFALVPAVGPLWYLIELGMFPERDDPDPEAPFLTNLGWACVGFGGLQLALLSILVSKTARPTPGVYDPRAMEVFLVVTIPLTLICLLGFLWSRWRAARS